MIADKNLLGVLIQETNSEGLITMCLSSGNLSTAPSRFARGCILIDTTTGKQYYNSGTSDAPVWNSISEITYDERKSIADITATTDGLTTGLIPAGTTFANVTSSSATKAVTLPTINANSIGQTIDLFVGSNGYELVTPASSENKINNVNADGTNQLDVAANSLLRCVQVSSTGWACYQVAPTTITVVAPDND